MTLPDGFRARLAHDTELFQGGQVLIGGSPLTCIRLVPSAGPLVASRQLEVDGPATARLVDRLLETNLAQPDLARASPVAAEDLTVVLPVRDRADQLDRALGALAHAHCLVVDDASLHPDTVAEVARQHDADLVRLPSNEGPAGARNAGLARVTTRYVAFVDCDVQVGVHALLMLSRHFSDPAVALVAPRIEGISVSPRPRWFERYDAAASSLTVGRRASNVRPGAAVTWLPSACLVARAAALGTGFAPDLRVGEDVDLVWRLVDAGHRVRYDPSVVAHHESRGTMRGWLGRKFVYGAGGASLAARHGARLAPAVLNPTYAVAAAAMLTRSRWSWLAATMAIGVGSRAISQRIHAGPERVAVATRLATRGLVWAVRQESALATRHWWPLAVAAAAASRPAKRALVSALLVDSVVALADQVPDGIPAGVATTLAGRRLDDLAYGAGLWWGALRDGSVRVLLPRRPARRQG